MENFSSWCILAAVLLFRVQIASSYEILCMWESCSCELTLQMSEWIANNREVFLVTYTQIGSSHQQALDLQSEHNQFAMSAMVRSAHDQLALNCGWLGRTLNDAAVDIYVKSSSINTS